MNGHRKKGQIVHKRPITVHLVDLEFEVDLSLWIERFWQIFGFGAEQYVRVQKRQILEVREGVEEGGEMVDVHRTPLQQQMRNGGPEFPKGQANSPSLQRDLGYMEYSEVCERGHVRSGRGGIVQIRVPGCLGELKVGNMTRWTVFSRSNIRAPPLESNLVEFYLREEMLLAPVGPHV